MVQRSLAFLWIFFLLGNLSFSQPSGLSFATSPPESGLPEGYQHFLLPTGLELLTIQDSSSPVISVHTVVRGFDTFEDERNDGVAWLISRMLPKANKDLFLEEMVWDEARQSGILFDTWIKGGNLHFHLSFPPNFLDPALSWLRSVLDGPIFDKDELKKEMLSVASDLQQNENNPEYYLRKDLEKGVWGGKFYQKGLLPTYASVSQLTTSDLKEYHKTNLRADRTLILAGGWLDEAVFKDAIDRHFSDWEAQKIYKEQSLEPLFGIGKLVLRNELAHEPIFFAAWIGPGVKEDPRATRSAEVFAYMSTMRKSPLQERFIASGLASEASFEFFPGSKESLLLLRIKAEENSALACLKAADFEVEKIRRSDYCDDTLLRVAAARLNWQQRFKAEKTSAFLAELGDWWAWSGRFERLSVGNEITLLTSGDLRNFSRKYLDPYEATSGMLCTSDVADDLPGAGFMADIGDIPDTKPLRESHKETKTEPDPPETSYTELKEILANYSIHFEVNSFAPDEDSRKSLAFIAGYLKKHPLQKVFLDGHADTQGNAAYNLVLSKRRAEAVRQYLVENFRISPEQLLTRGFGESMPAYSEENPLNMAKNRRVEVSPVQNMEGEG